MMDYLLRVFFYEKVIPYNQLQAIRKAYTMVLFNENYIFYNNL